jgi:hypothetical protein
MLSIAYELYMLIVVMLNAVMLVSWRPPYLGLNCKSFYNRYSYCIEIS